MKASLSPREFKELLLSHHPDHKCFREDVVVLFGRRVCAGCLLAYPVAVVVFFALSPTGWQSVFVAIGLSALSQLRRLAKNRQINLFFRVVAGAGLGYGFGGLLWAVASQNLIAISLLLLGAAGYAFARIYCINKRIEECLKDTPDS